MKRNHLRLKWSYPAALNFWWNLITDKLLYEKIQITAGANCQNLLISTLQFCTPGPSFLIIFYELDNAVIVPVCNTCPATLQFKKKKRFHALQNSRAHFTSLAFHNLRQIILSHIFVAIEHSWMYFPYTQHFKTLGYIPASLNKA